MKEPILKKLRGLFRVPRGLTNIVCRRKGQEWSVSNQVIEPHSGSVTEAGLGQMIEIAQDMSASLHVLAQVQEALSDSTEDQRREMLLAVQSIDKTLKELADNVVELRKPP